MRIIPSRRSFTLRLVEIYHLFEESKHPFRIIMRLLCPNITQVMWYLRPVISKRDYIKTLPTVNRIIHEVIKKEEPQSENSQIVKRINETGGNLTIVELLELKAKYFKSTCLKNLESEAILRNLIENISQKLNSNPDLQVFLINELKMLIPSHKQLFKTAVRTLIENNRSVRTLQDKAVTLRTKGPDETSLRYSYYRILILLCLTLHNSILASLMLLKDTEFTIKLPLVNQVINALLLKNPKHEEYDLDLVMKLAERFQIKFTEFQASQALTKLQVCSNIILTKKFQEYLLLNTTFSTRNAKIKRYYELIQNDFKMKNSAGVYINWKIIHNQYDNILKHDIRIISILIQAFNQSKQYIKLSTDIIRQLPPEYYSNQLLTSHLIAYSGKIRDVNLANMIIQQLEAPLPRELLSDLLRLNFIFKDMTGMEKILNQILTTYKTLSAKENEIIVKGLLKQGKFQEALVFADGLDPRLGSSTFLTVIHHLVTYKGKKLNSEDILIIDRFITKMDSLCNPDDSFWHMLSSLYFKYLTRSPTSEVLNSAKFIYENSVKNFVNRAYKDPLKNSKTPSITTNPFKSVYMEEIVLQIPPRTRVIIIKTILDQAIKIKDSKILNWCCFELFELGLSPLAIKIDISRKMNSVLGQIGISSDESMRRFVNTWESLSIKFLKNNKTLKKLEMNYHDPST